MHSAELLSQSAILFGTALIAALAFRFIKAPSILGFLCTGILIGPSVLHMVNEEEVESFAEFGLVLLLFVIGLELSPQHFIHAGRRLLVMTAIQLVGTALAALACLTLFAGMGAVPALLMGIAISLSSTAIVLKTLSDRDEIQTPAGHISTGNLLLQDVYVIVLMLLFPFFTKSGGASAGVSILQALIGLASMILAVIAVRMLLPKVLAGLGRYGGPELLTLFAVFMAFGGAAFAGLIGWPLALGSCMAGLLLAQADQRHQLVAEITPFRDVFNALFFISLGMLVDMHYVLAHWMSLTGIVLSILAAKTLINSAAVVIAGWPLRVGVQAGIGLCTVSEFGYVFAREANSAQLLDVQILDSLIPIIVGTMMVGAALLPLSGAISRSVERLVRRGHQDEEPDGSADDGVQRVVVVGYGINGKNLCRVLQATHIPCCVLEMNPMMAREGRDNGLEVFVGDGTRMRILAEAGLNRARALVIAVNDRKATRRMVSQARQLRPDVPIIVRTDYVNELEPLMSAGATTVIPADFEVSIKLFATVLTEFRVPDNIIQAQIASVRAGGYGLLRDETVELSNNMQELLEVFRLTATKTYYIGDESAAVGKTIAELNLRARSGVTIIAVVRGGKPNTNPAANFELSLGDVLVLVGSHAELDAAQGCLNAPEKDSAPAA